MNPPISNLHKAAIALIAAAFSAQVLFLIADKSPTTDETSFHMVNGYAYLLTHDFRMSPATPPALREWMAMPWLAWHPALRLDRASWKEAESVPFSVEFFYGDHRDMADRLLFASRFMVFLLALALGAAVFCWARKLYGAGAGLFALTLFAFCPTLVGHSALATVDLGTALFFFCTMFFLYRTLESEGRARFPWFAAVALGLALASKYTGVLLFPAILLLAVKKRGFFRGCGVFCGMLAVALLTVWTTYFFEIKPLLADVPRVEEKVGYISAISDFLFFKNTAARDFVVHAAHDWPIPLSSWILGFAGIARSHRDDYLHYFMGRWSEHQVWYHYLASFALKTTLAMLSLLAARKALWLARKGETDRPEVPYLVLPPVTIFLMTCIDTTGVGMRYLIPAFPFLYVWVSGLWAAARGKALKACLCGALALHVSASLMQFPNNIAYFNALAGGPVGGRNCLRYSDLDWGQELKNLGKWVRAHNVTIVRTRLFGTYDAAFYGIPSQLAEIDEQKIPRKAWYAISANYYDAFEWAKHRRPDADIGHAILIYDMRKGTGS